MSREDGTASTNSAADISLVSVEAMLRAMEDTGLLPATNGGKWTLISPDGKIYVGEVTELLPALLKDHPLLRFPR
jgi:hypothetical protein